MNSFGANLKRLRRAAGLTQKQLAEISGVASGTIGNYEAGHRANVTIDVVLKLADALGVDAEEFGVRRRPDLEKKLQTISPEIDEVKEHILIQTFMMLNSVGQDEAIKRISELTEIRRYCRKD